MKHIVAKIMLTLVAVSLPAATHAQNDIGAAGREVGDSIQRLALGKADREFSLWQEQILTKWEEGLRQLDVDYRSEPELYLQHSRKLINDDIDDKLEETGWFKRQRYGSALKRMRYAALRHIIRRAPPPLPTPSEPVGTSKK